MKKFFAIILTVSALVGCLCSCGKDSDTQQPDSTTTSESTTSSTSSTNEQTESTTNAAEKEETELNFIGKTLGELEANGYEYQGYGAFGSEYTFSYITVTRSYDVHVVVSAEADKELDDLSIFDDDYDEKCKAIRESLIITDIIARNEEPLSEQELSKYVGQKASILIDDGFEVNGYMGLGGEYTFFFSKDRQNYLITLDDTASTIMKDREFGDDNYKTQILDSFITKIKYDSPS